MDGIIQGIVLPLVAVAPGFVLVTVFRRDRHAPDPSDARFAATALVASIVPHAIFLFWTVDLMGPVAQSGFAALDAREALLWTCVVVLVAPSILGIALSYLVEASWAQSLFRSVGWTRAARTRNAWDWLFQPASPMWLLIELKSGRLVGGLWDEGSVATLGPEPRQLLLGDPYTVDETGFIAPIAGSPKLWIDGTEITTMFAYRAEVHE